MTSRANLFPWELVTPRTGVCISELKSHRILLISHVCRWSIKCIYHTTFAVRCWFCVSLQFITGNSCLTHHCSFCENGVILPSELRRAAMYDVYLQDSDTKLPCLPPLPDWMQTQFLQVTGHFNIKLDWVEWLKKNLINKTHKS